VSDTSAPAAAPTPSRWQRWLFVGSLALNLLFIGGLAGLWFKGPPPHGGPHRGPSPTAFGLMKFSRDLPPERRDVVRKPLREARAPLRALRAELVQARRKAAEVLGSSDYTTEALQAAMTSVADLESRMRQVGRDTLVSAIRELTPEERRRLAEAWTQRLDFEKSRKGRRDKDKPEESEPSVP
jgi:uncharacterized membrane protein